MDWSDEVLKAAYNFGYACAKDGYQCMFTFVDETLQAEYEKGYKTATTDKEASGNEQ